MDLCEKLIKRTVKQMMDVNNDTVAEFDLTHAFADPRGQDSARPKPRSSPHTLRDPELASIRQQLVAEVTEAVAMNTPADDEGFLLAKASLLKRFHRDLMSTDGFKLRFWMRVLKGRARAKLQRTRTIRWMALHR